MSIINLKEYRELVLRENIEDFKAANLDTVYVDKEGQFKYADDIRIYDLVEFTRKLVEIVDYRIDDRKVVDAGEAILWNMEDYQSMNSTIIYSTKANEKYQEAREIARKTLILKLKEFAELVFKILDLDKNKLDDTGLSVICTKLDADGHCEFLGTLIRADGTNIYENGNMTSFCIYNYILFRDTENNLQKVDIIEDDELGTFLYLGKTYSMDDISFKKER